MMEHILTHPLSIDGVCDGLNGGSNSGMCSKAKLVSPPPPPPITPTCNNNGIQDNGETGVDCGSGNCPTCPQQCRECNSCNVCITGTIQSGGTCSVIPPSDPSNLGNSCGSCGGTIQCNGACSVSTPSNYGNSCDSPANSCSQTNSGTIQCDGSCSETTAPPNPPNYRQLCNSPSNNCGETFSGTVQCDGSCSETTAPPNRYPCQCVSNQGGSCGSCGGTIQCNGACSVSTPSNYGNSCDGPANSCGMTFSGTIQCDDSCSETTAPSESDCCTPPESCESCITCSGGISICESGTKVVGPPLCSPYSCNAPNPICPPVDGGWSDWGDCSCNLPTEIK